jgi:hypothetical protein
MNDFHPVNGPQRLNLPRSNHSSINAIRQRQCILKQSTSSHAFSFDIGRRGRILIKLTQSPEIVFYDAHEYIIVARLDEFLFVDFKDR